jgi:hypothetical protein
MAPFLAAYWASWSVARSEVVHTRLETCAHTFEEQHGPIPGR